MLSSTSSIASFNSIFSTIFANLSSGSYFLRKTAVMKNCHHQLFSVHLNEWYM
jgi:hypothetical protein